MRPTIGRLAAAAAILVVAAGAARTAAAEPPPWAPAHGWRAHHEHEKHDGHARYRHDRPPVVYQQPVIVTRGTSVACDRSLLTGNKTLLTQILGGAGGAVAGAQFGQGTGKLAATAAGALLGVLIGTEVGGSLDAADAACTQQTLEEAETGRPVVWNNPDAGARYSVEPTRTFRTSGTYCREYTTRAQVGDRLREAYGTACRQPDGSWHIVR